MVNNRQDALHIADVVVCCFCAGNGDVVSACSLTVSLTAHGRLGGQHSLSLAVYKSRDGVGKCRQIPTGSHALVVCRDGQGCLADLEGFGDRAGIVALKCDDSLCSSSIDIVLVGNVVILTRSQGHSVNDYRSNAGFFCRTAVNGIIFTKRNVCIRAGLRCDDNLCPAG